MSAARQIPLDLTFRPSYGRDSLVVASCNQMAVGMIDRWPDWSGYPLVTLFGPPASGKHHLASLWASRAQAHILSVTEFFEAPLEELISQQKNFVIERADFIIGDVAQEEKLFHLYNHAHQGNIFLFLTMQTHPAQFTYAHGGHLASRLQAAPILEITKPDEQTLAAVMVKLCADRHMDIAPEIVFYALDRMERTFLSVKTLVEMLDQESLADKRKITIPLLRQVMTRLAESSK